ncbi:cell wall-binding protein [Bacillus cereus]|uniref:cell wall-binding protein n=1 Tax=Bacillus cereus TaxID=1396 RepID=UPI000BF378E1|nr:cell wall-binding protein [Bacillus cereus]PER78731.1 cell wall-binding protein [Bacillus cereus]
MRKFLKANRKKVIPVTAALGILVSATPIAENKAQAASARSIARVMSVTISALGIVRNIHGAVATNVGHADMSTYTGPYAENVSYKAPSFQAGEFNISMYHTQSDLNFEKPIKVLRPNGQITTHQLKSGQQLKITEAGTIIDLNPNEESVKNHDLLYITQAQLDDGKTGVALNQVKTMYVEKTTGENRVLVNEFYKLRFGPSSLDGFKGLGVDRFSYLTEEQKQVATLTSQPVYKETLSNYVMNNATALADFNNRLVQIVTTNPRHIMDATIKMGGSNIPEEWKIIPYQAGTNKVVVKTSNGYFTGERENRRTTQYTESIDDARVFKVSAYRPSGSRENDSATVYFELLDESGVYPFVRDNENNKFIDSPYYPSSFFQTALQPRSHANINFINKTNAEVMYLLVNLFGETSVNNWWRSNSHTTSVM